MSFSILKKLHLLDGSHAESIFTNPQTNYFIGFTLIQNQDLQE